MRSLLITCALATLAAATSAAPPQESLAAGLDEARELMLKGKWEDAEALLIRLVPDDPDEGHAVLSRWADIEDGLALAGFWKEFERPEAKEVVSGKLLSWSEKSGKIKLRYELGDGGLVGAGGPTSGETEEVVQVGDFMRAEGFSTHPMKFKGPYTVELEGEALSSADLPMILIDFYDDLRPFYGVVFDDLTRIVEVADGEGSILDDASTMMRYGRKYSFKVGVAATSVSAFYNGKRLLKVKRDRSEYGLFGFSHLRGIERLTITGEIEPAWISSKTDERVMTEWTLFRDNFDPYLDLPSWTFDRVEGEALRAREPLDIIPGLPDSRNRVQYNIVKKFLERDPKAALKLVKNLPSNRISDDAREWLMVNVLLWNGLSVEALEALQRATRQFPEFFEARLLEARLLVGLRGFEEGRYALEGLVVDFPEYLEPYLDLGEKLLFEDKPNEVRELVDVAVSNGVPPRAVAGLGRTASRQEHGPVWGRVFEHESRNYIVRSDLSRDICYEIATELEKFYKKYVRRVRRPDSAAERKFHVYFFSGVGGYQAYLEDILGDKEEGTLGVYSPWLKQLVIWNSPEKQMVMRTVRHEGFHQYLDRITSEAPFWLDEGMAEYFEQARLIQGRWKDDQINREHVATLRSEKEWTPLETLVHGDARHFKSNPNLHYPESWALVHYLLNSDKDNEARLETLLDALSAGEKREAALASAFAGVDWQELESALHAYVKELSRAR